MEIGIRTYVILALLLLMAGQAAADECCKSDVSSQCCCVDVEKLDVCTPQLCTEVKVQDRMNTFMPPSSDVSFVTIPSVEHVTDDVAVNPPRTLAPIVRQERAPPPLFADLTLCFLPPPVLS